MIQFHELPACARYYRQPALENAVGYIPVFFNEGDKRSAKEQVNDSYIGGWHSFLGFRKVDEATVRKMYEPDDNIRIPILRYPGDPVLQPLAYAYLRDELIVVYPSAWVAIVHPDGDFEVARLD